MSDSWNPDQYNKFQSERSQPFWDLAAKIDFSGVKSMLDVGCGTGELTKALHERQGLVTTLGFDSSSKMLAESEKRRAPGLSFALGNVDSFEPDQKFDVVFSNAALQWVERHIDLFPRVLTWLNPGGRLAVQMPMNFDHPSHTIADEVAEGFGLKRRSSPVLKPENYGELLWKQGLRDLDINVHVYLHQMAAAQEVVEWTKGTLLTHYEKQMAPERYAEFLRAYTDEFVAVAGPGEYLYPFKRLFIVAKVK